MSHQPGNRKVIVFTAFADTAHYLYEQLRSLVVDELGLGMAEVTGAAGGKTTVPGVRGDLSEILTCFSPVSKERDTVYPRLAGKDIDVLIATDCISEGQNLQDCDLLVNFDIHWNPVRVVQRFGRVDRIGSKNDRIQLVNFWPNVELDKYIQLKERVENRMHATVMASTGDDDYLNEDEKGDLEYRRAQLEQMQSEVVDLEDVSGGVSITDLGLNDFRMDLVAYHEAQSRHRACARRHRRRGCGRRARHHLRAAQRQPAAGCCCAKSRASVLPGVRESRR